VQSALVAGASWVFWGAHAEDAENWAYPDCTPEFNGGMANAIYIGTYHKVRLAVPFQWLRKYQIVSRAFQLQAPLELTWSCYRGREKHCGTCPTCRARKAAFAQASHPDPTLYER
jgi:7-cyano-7-deazaguanine synthase